jgi:cytochrome c-type biogenesis protein CcmH/NrfG
VESLQGILRDNPDNVDAMRNLAGIYFSKKLHLDDAEALLRHAVQVAPGFVAAWMLLGPVLMERSKFLDAIDAFTEATRLAPEDAEPGAAWVMPMRVPATWNKASTRLHGPWRSIPMRRVYRWAMPMC